MKVYQTRQDQLRQLLLHRFNGVQKRLADAIGRQPDYVSRLLRGDKRLGESLAREIEETLGLPHYWLDRPSGEHAETKGTGVSPDDVSEDADPLSARTEYLRSLLHGRIADADYQELSVIDQVLGLVRLNGPGKLKMALEIVEIIDRNKTSK